MGDDLRLIRTLRRQRFDYAFELGDNSRGRWLSLLSGARKRAVAPETIRPTADFVVFHPATRWERKEWPVEQWIETGKELAERFGSEIARSDPGRIREAPRLVAASVSEWTRRTKIHSLTLAATSRSVL